MFDLITKARGEDERPKKTRWGWGARMGGSARKTMLFVGSLALIVVPSCWAGLVNLHCCCSTQLQCLEQASLYSALLPWPHHTSTGSGWWGRLAWWVFAQLSQICFCSEEIFGIRAEQLDTREHQPACFLFFYVERYRIQVGAAKNACSLFENHLDRQSLVAALSRHTLNFNQCAKLSRSLSIVRNVRIKFF